MFGKNKPSAYPELRTTRVKQKGFMFPTASYWLVNCTLLFVPVWFWFSVMLRLAFGTDYFFDVLFDQIGQNPLGNGILVALIVFFPGVAVGYNGLYRIHHNKAVWSGMTIVSMLLLIIGFFAAMKKG